MVVVVVVLMPCHWTQHLTHLPVSPIPLRQRNPTHVIYELVQCVDSFWFEGLSSHCLEDQAETVMTVEDSWGLSSTALPSSMEKLREDVKNLMLQCIKKYGGPENYLRLRYATKSAKQDWLNYLGEIQKVELGSNFSVCVDLPITNCKALSEARLRFVAPECIVVETIY